MDDESKFIVKVQYDTGTAHKSLQELGEENENAVKKIEQLSKAIIAQKSNLVELNKKMADGKISQVDYSTAIAEQTHSMNRDIQERKKYINVIQAEIGSVKRAKAENQVLREERNKLALSTGKNSEQVKKLNAQIDANTKIIKGNVDAQSRWHMGVEKVRGAYLLIAGAIGGAIGVLKKFGEAVINSSDALKDDWQVATSQASAAFNVFKTSIATMDFSNFFTNMKEAIKLAEDYTRGMQKIEDLTRSLEIQEIKQQGELARLKKTYQDVGLSIEVRTKALEKYKAIVLDLGTKETKNTGDALKLELDKAAQITGLTKEQISLFIEQNDMMSELSQTALDLKDSQINAFSPLGAWKLVTKGLTGSLKETSDANNTLIESLKKGGIEGEKAVEFAEKLRKLSPEGIDKLTAAFKASYAAQNKFDEETVRQEALLNRLDNTTNKLAKSEKDRAEATKAATEGITLKRIEASEQYTMQKNTETDFEIMLNEEMNRIRLVNDKQYNDESAEAYKKRIDEQIAEEERGAQIISELRKKLADEIEEGAKTIAKDQFNASIDDKLHQAEVESKIEEDRLKNRLDKGLISEQEYKDKIEAINIKMRQKSAIAEQKKALFSIAVDTIVNSVKALGTPPAPNFIAAALTAAAGAAQAIVVKAKPIPKFFKGEPFMPKDTIGTIAEKGFEYFKKPGEDWKLATTEQLMHFPKGSRILTHEQTKEKIKNDTHSDEILNELLKEQKLTRKALSRKEDTTIKNNLICKTIENNNTRTNYIQRFI